MSSSLEVVYFLGFLAPYFERRCVLPSHLQYRELHEQCGIEPREDLLHDPHEQVQYCALVDCVLHLRCRHLLHFHLIDAPLATLRIAEFGFFRRRCVDTVHTPLRCGQESSAADLLFCLICLRPFLTSC